MFHALAALALPAVCLYVSRMDYVLGYRGKNVTVGKVAFVGSESL
jgi:uncharacterized membrane protein YgdD (TMEM256/DUF423 family)